ncbi:Putative hydro-lyase [Frankliniella fusca]|uniref:Hydro-lyase n=1 Tax=Frankliniella fusca TaxID=407009 RepID=A0AAE1HCS9_9NEOP|nr:Putative hydro-lyase [Frankliniella fusca]
MEAMNRVRMIILGKNSAAVHANNNANSLEQTLSRISEAALTDELDPDEPPEENSSEEEGAYQQGEGASSPNNPPPPNYSDLQEEMKSDGIEFLAGGVAFKFKKEYKNLGHPTREGKQSNLLPSWVQQLSFGGLMEPTPEWLEKAHSIEKHFNSFHGNHQSI